MQIQNTIMLDGYNLGLEQGTGVATYARNLSFACGALGYRTEILYGLRVAGGADPMLREVGFFDPGGAAPSAWSEASRHVRQFVTSPLGVRAVEVPVSGTVITRALRGRMPHFDRIWNAHDLWGRSYRHHAFFNRLLEVKGTAVPDVMHWTYPVPLRIRGARNVYTLHDLVPLRLPYTTLDNKRDYLARLRTILAEADHIVTVSESSRADIIDLFGTPENKVTNTYQSVDIPQHLVDKPEDVVAREVEGAFGLPHKGYFLFFGAVEPKKNVGRLIEAHLASGVPEPLVIVGKAAWKADQELRLLGDDARPSPEQAAVRERVRRFDYAPFPLLVSLIRAAKAVVFPSLYEGFGLPVLESMLLGTPVITSDQASLPEVTGDAALLVDPYDTRAIAEAIRILSQDADLRSDLSRRGRIQAERFSPAQHQARIGAVYAKVLGR